MKREVVICGVPFEHPDIKNILKRIKEDGATSIQIYTYWNVFEPEKRGEFDFSEYDAQVQLIKEAGLKYVPFLLMGPRYAAPQWWLDDKNHKGLVCLEHGKTSPIESIWNKEFRKEIERVLKAFSKHYLPMDVLESVQPGICGDYGEAIMPVHGNWPGVYHTHRGMWCGGEDAVRDFRKSMKEKYKAIEKLNSAWRTVFGDFEEIRPFMKHKAPSRTAYFDLIEWYRGSMTEYVEFWMKTTREYFPNTPIYMCTGGLETAEDASMFSEQAKVCAKYSGGLRLTNEINDFYENFFATAYTCSACKQYGAYCGLEPVGPLTKEGIGSRIFSSAVFSNRQIFFYYYNIYPNNDFNSEQAQMYRKYIGLIEERENVKKTAVFWPGYVGADDGGIPERIRATAVFLRKMTDYLFVNDNMVADGILDNVKVLIIPCEVFTKSETTEKICAWVKNGGILFTAGRIKDLELEPIKEFDEMIGLTEESDFCEGLARYEVCEDDEFANFTKCVRYISEVGYSKIASDAKVLSVVKAQKYHVGCEMNAETVYNAFSRKYGKGNVISYFGPTKETDGELGAFGAILKDVLQGYCEDLTVKEGEVVRGKIDGDTYALYPDGNIERI